MKYYCRNKENCMNKDICFDCFVKINNDLPYFFNNKKDLNYFINENNCTILEKYENKNHAKFIILLFKEFKFAFYECQECFKWYRVIDHPFRLANNIKNNQNLSPTCSIKCKGLHTDKSSYKNNGYKMKYCKYCEKETLHNGNICCVCNPNAKTHNNVDYSKIVQENKKPGFCTKCGVFNNKRNVAGLGIDVCNCFNENLEQIHKLIKNHYHICSKCNYEEVTHGTNWRCPKCGNVQMSGGFDKEIFYSKKINIIYFNSLEHNVKFEDFNNLMGKIGVWSRWTDKNHGNYCLDVCKTIDIGNEMLSSIRSFDSLLKNPNQPLDVNWKAKYKNQLIDAGGFDKDNPGKIIFKLVFICDKFSTREKNEQEALKIEAQYAHDNKAKYWSPEPGQKILNPNL